MIYRGTFQGGVVVLSTPCALPEGTPVEVRRRPAAERRGNTANGARPARSDRKAAAKPGKGSPPARKTQKTDLPGFGMWKDREDWRGRSTEEIARELRRRALGERYHG